MAIIKKGAAAKEVHGDVGSAGWDEVSDEVERRVVMINIYGDTGTGRTRLALTSPGPIALAHTAEKIDGVVQKAKAEGKVIRVHNFGGSFAGSQQEIIDQASTVWKRAQSLWNDAIDNWARTTIMDTDTEGWELIRLAYFGELNPKGRTDSLYGPVNARWRSMWKRYKREYQCNCIAISQTKDEYVTVKKQGGQSSERTGKQIRAGQKGIPFDADVIIRTDKDFDDSGKRIFRATVEKAWYNGDLEGTVFENEECRIPYIMSLITGIDEEEWNAGR